MNRIVFALLVCACSQSHAQHCGQFFKGYGGNHYAAPFFAHNKAVAYVAPVVVVPDIAYSPTTALQLAAVKTNYVRTDADYARFLQFKAYESGLAAGAQQRLQHAPSQQQIIGQQQQAQPLVSGQPGAAGVSVPPTVNSPPPAPGQSVTGQSVTGQSVISPQPGQPRVLGIVQHCGKCHGAQLETPRGNPPIYIDPTKQLTSDDIIRAVRVMRLPETDPLVMPPAPAKLTAEDKGGIFEELLSLQIGGPTQ